MVDRVCCLVFTLNDVFSAYNIPDDISTTSVRADSSSKHGDENKGAAAAAAAAAEIGATASKAAANGFDEIHRTKPNSKTSNTPPYTDHVEMSRRHNEFDGFSGLRGYT